MEKLSNNLIASGSRDYLINVWDLTNETNFYVFTLLGHDKEVDCLLKIDKNKLLSGNMDSTI